jgi:hypothetical protein
VTVPTLGGGIELLGVPTATQTARNTFERLGKKDL